MMTFIRNKKQFVITKENRQRILKDIDDLANLPNGVFAKVKQYEHGYYIKIIVDKTYIKESTPVVTGIGVSVQLVHRCLV